MHIHILKTIESEYIVYTDNEEWDWHNFFENAVIPACNIHKIITLKKLSDGSREINEFTTS